MSKSENPNWNEKSNVTKLIDLNKSSEIDSQANKIEAHNIFHF